MIRCSAATSHPLDPLTEGELAIVRDVLTTSGRFSPQVRFAWIELEEPAKTLVEQFVPGQSSPRRARAVALDFGQRKNFAITVDIAARRLAGIEELGRLQPGLTDDDMQRARQILDADSRVKAALIAHGLDIPGAVSDAVGTLFVDVGEDPSLQHETGRLIRVLFISDQDAINDYGPILDSVSAVIDVFSGRVVRLDSSPGVPLRKVPHDIFDSGTRGRAPQPKPVITVEPRGRNVTIESNVIQWTNWELRLGFNGREGLVLYQVRFNDHGKKRSILYRASVSEILTRYGAPTGLWAFMELDEGDFGLGNASVPVNAGREVPANAVTLSPVLPDAGARSFSRIARNRIYVYERDAGLLMYYRQSGATVQARSSELVIGFLAAVGNYAYGLRWVFRQDGSFAFEAELAGQVLTKLVESERCRSCNDMTRAEAAAVMAEDRYGALIDPHLLGVYHQHWFSLRLDFDVDGTNNAVMENDAQIVPQEQDAGAGAGRLLTVAHEVLRSSRAAKRDVNDAAARTWTVFNPASRSATGRPAGYCVVPIENARTTVADSAETGTAAFTFHHFWATPYRDGVFYADGTYPNQPPPDYSDTLYHYASDEPIYDTDVVVWYSLGETHVVRPEDFPLMPNTTLSVHFVPDGFFVRNPALGLATEHGNPR